MQEQIHKSQKINQNLPVQQTNKPQKINQNLAVQQTHKLQKNKLSVQQKLHHKQRPNQQNPPRATATNTNPQSNQVRSDCKTNNPHPSLTVTTMSPSGALHLLRRILTRPTNQSTDNPRSHNSSIHKGRPL
jgi:hypothetical protein